MPAVVAYKNGVPDTAPGASVLEYLALQSALAAAVQGVAIIPHGDPWQIKGSLSYTPTLITDTLPPNPVLAWGVPEDKALLFTGGIYHCLAAATDYVRVVRRHFLAGVISSALPAATAAPTTTTVNTLAGSSMGAGTRSYKVAPYNMLRQEGNISPAAANLVISATQNVSISFPALPAGAIGYNIYRTLAGGSTWYYIGSSTQTNNYIDGQPDAAVDTSLTPSVSWAVGYVAGETMDGPGEAIFEVGPVAVTSPPGTIWYLGASGQTRQGIVYTMPTAIGARLRFKPYNEATAFTAAPTAAANLWRGPLTDKRRYSEKDNGIRGIVAMSFVPATGDFVVWGQQVIGSTLRNEAAAAIKAMTIIPTNPHGVLIPPGGEIVAEVGALATGVAAVRDISLKGMLIPATAT